MKVYDKDGNFKDSMDISDIVVRNVNDRLVVLSKVQAIIYINNTGLYVKRQLNDAKTKVISSYTHADYVELLKYIDSFNRNVPTAIEHLTTEV